MVTKISSNGCDYVLYGALCLVVVVIITLSLLWRKAIKNWPHSRFLYQLINSHTPTLCVVFTFDQNHLQSLLEASRKIAAAAGCG